MSISTAGIGNQLHVVIVDGGRVLHRIQHLDGSWTPWAIIVTPEGQEFVEASCANSGNGLRVLLKDVAGLYWHDIRKQNGQWQGVAQLPV